MISGDLVAQILGFPCFIFHTGTNLDISCQEIPLVMTLKVHSNSTTQLGFVPQASALRLFQIGQPREVQLVK